MSLAHYPLGGRRQLRITRVGDLIVMAVHDGAVCKGEDQHVIGGCLSGPLAVPKGAALDTFRSALADVAGETGSREATDPELAATRTPGGGRATS